MKTPALGPWSFYRGALAIAVPVMLQTLITSLVSLVDNFMVAGLGDVKMAGVNAANQVNFIFLVLVNTVNVAGGIYLAQHRGAGDEEGMRQAFRFKLIMGMGAGALHSVLALAFAEPLVRLMVAGNGSEADIVRQGAAYMRAVAPSFIPTAAAVAFATSYREIGRTRVPLVISSLAAFAHIGMNWLLIYGNLGMPRMEAPGAALASDVSRLLELAGFLAWTMREKPAFRIRIRQLVSVDMRLFGSILGRSTQMLFSEMTWVFSETVITALYNSRGGAQTVAGMSAAWALANLFFLVFSAIQTVTMVTVGSTLGAGNLEEARKRARWVMSGSLPFGAIVGVCAAASTAVIPLVFSNLTPEARVTTRAMLLVISAYIPLWTLLNAQFAVSRSGGDTMMGIWVDVGVTWLVFIPAAWFMARFTPVGPVFLFGVAKLSDFMKTGVAFWWLSKERWVRNLASSD